MIFLDDHAQPIAELVLVGLRDGGRNSERQHRKQRAYSCPRSSAEKIEYHAKSRNKRVWVARLVLSG